ncbi:hypothetical protein [uncultured Nocardioides sp.]|nr:hypothetical protein [uncultured Nocardioides sp.]
MTTTTEAPSQTDLDRAVRESVAAAPPLSDDTRDAVARLLTGKANR